MFLVTQFPFSDIRGFVESATGRLTNPTWPIAQVDKEFIRSTGSVRRRPRGGLDTWAGEELYGEASSALKFPNGLRQIVLGDNVAPERILRATRRFHSDGAVARLEVGVKLVPLGRRRPTNRPILPLIRQLLDLSVGVGREARNGEVIKLFDAGDALAHHFLKATTSHSWIRDNELQPWWFSAGTPAIIAEHTEPIELPRNAKKVLEIDSGSITLSHFWLEEIRRGRFSVWTISNERGDPSALRKLRVHLSRLHAERESLQCVIRAIKGNLLTTTRASKASDDLQEYLSNTVRVLDRPERFGHDQFRMLYAARSAFAEAFEGETTTLTQMRGQVVAQLQAYIERQRPLATPVTHIYQGSIVSNVQIGNGNVIGELNVVTADKIKNSFNKAETADVNIELQKKLKELVIQVAALAKELPPDDALRVSEDLEALTKEATAKNPRPQWIDLSSKGLLEAAKTVAAMAGPVTVAVKSVLALLTH